MLDELTFGVLIAIHRRFEHLLFSYTPRDNINRAVVFKYSINQLIHGPCGWPAKGHFTKFLAIISSF